jgi:hypothetical protein
MTDLLDGALCAEDLTELHVDDVVERVEARGCGKRLAAELPDTTDDADDGLGSDSQSSKISGSFQSDKSVSIMVCGLLPLLTKRVRRGVGEMRGVMCGASRRVEVEEGAMVASGLCKDLLLL